MFPRNPDADWWSCNTFLLFSGRPVKVLVTVFVTSLGGLDEREMVRGMDVEAKEGLSADFLFVFWLALRACQKYSAILHIKTSNKLFIIQLLYLKGIS